MISISILLGIVVGAFGTLIGAGGGFVLVPILLFLLPQIEATHVVAISMLAVAANAVSGSLAYARKKQIHWRSAIVFSLVGAPGIWLGTYLNSKLDRQEFEQIFGPFMVLIAIYLFYRTFKAKAVDAHQIMLTRQKWVAGCVVSALVGVLASFLGIGGGIIHVPFLSQALEYPVHLATGTSHFVLAVTATIAVLDHFVSGHYAQLEAWVYFLVLGIIAGAQIGARLSKRVSSKMILRLLALALISVGIRLCIRAYS